MDEDASESLLSRPDSSLPSYKGARAWRLFAAVVMSLIVLGLIIGALVLALTVFKLDLNTPINECSVPVARNITIVSQNPGKSDCGFDVYQDGKILERLRGVGYSPTPPGQTPANAPNGDYFTRDYRYLYERDLHLMRQMGVTLIRLWSWDFRNDHSHFLDLLWNDGVQPILALIPFMFDKAIYPSLSDSVTRSEIEVDFGGFVARYKDYPAVFGYLIGNELDEVYTEKNDREELFTIVNVMVSIRDAIEPIGYRHPISIPLTAEYFAEIVGKYDLWSKIDFWSLQVYTSSLLQLLTDFNLNSTKPLMITEFGADALDNVKENPGLDEEGQWEKLYNMWHQINEANKDQNFIIGAVVMEWADEWWKGNFADISHPNCPTSRYDQQSYCGHQITDDNYVHEEWLGLLAQDEYQQADNLFCVKPRKAFYNFASEWNPDNVVTSTSICQNSEFLNSNTSSDFKCCGRRTHYNEWYLMVLPYVGFCCLLLVIPLLMFRCKTQADEMSKPRYRFIAPSERGVVYPYLTDNIEVVNELKAQLRVRVEHAFKSLVAIPPRPSDNFDVIWVPCTRVHRLVWDRMLCAPPDQWIAVLASSGDTGPSTSALVDSSVRIVYLKYMEGHRMFRLYKGAAQTDALGHTDAMLRELALYNLVSLAAGTINHSPEKVCEVLDFALAYMVGPGARCASNTLDTMYNHLKDIFAVYYEDVISGKFNYDDVNAEAVGKKWEPLYFWNKPIMPTRSQKHLRGGDDDDTDVIKVFFSTRKRMVKSFPEKGGWLTALLNFGWVVRANVWFLMSAWFMQNNPSTAVCLPEFVRLLAQVDAVLCLILIVLHFRVLGLANWNIHHMVSFIWSVAATFCVFFFTDGTKRLTIHLVGEPLTLGVDTVVALAYLGIVSLVAVLHDVYLSLQPSPLPIPGRSSFLGGKVTARSVWQRLFFLGANSIYWGGAAVLHWFMCYNFLVPAVVELTPALCTCTDIEIAESLTVAQALRCSIIARSTCFGALAFTWISSLLISFCVMFACYQAMMVVFGVVVGVSNRVGNIKSWYHVQKSFRHIKINCFDSVSRVCSERIESIKQDSASSVEPDEDDGKLISGYLWEKFVASLTAEYLITPQEAERLVREDFSEPPQSAEAKRRVIHFLWSLESMTRHTSHTGTTRYRQRFRVRTMPSWTVLVPAFNETILFTADSLRRPSWGRKRLSVLEYLAATYPDEWAVFARTLNKEADELMFAFLHVQESPFDFDIVKWASMRGQTLYKTTYGLSQYRVALRELASLEETRLPYDMLADDQRLFINELVDTKFQIIIAHQTFSSKPDWKDRHEMDTMREHFDFDLVYDQGVNSFMLPPLASRPIKVVRPGRLKIGEGKAENQIHALAFAFNEVLQANDMNQGNSFENALKVPMVLDSFFNTSEEHYLNKNEDVSAPYRIVGFPEYTYTRPLSKVGEFMGSAEFAFVTITQRVLHSPLQVRAHYGHPDFICGYWARTRGGSSKASPGINVNEDIFAGYEMFARGEGVSYVEFLEQQKGRETAFFEAFTFESKLAQGAAQQIRSRDVYNLNQRLPLFRRLSLFFGTLGFYVTSALMAVSINYYMYCITLFTIAGVSYHQLGLLHAVIQIPWLFQVGFVQAFPMLVEVIVEHGFFTGVLKFLQNLLIGLLFFVFHLQTKAHFFSRGLLTGQGGYHGTGRGFGLDRRSLKDIYKTHLESHFFQALRIFGCVIIYALVTADSVADMLLRTMFVNLVCISWMFAPVLFNPYPTSEDLEIERQDLYAWITTPFVRQTLKDHIDENEQNREKRKENNVKWLGAKGLLSWKAWWWHIMLEQWDSEDKMFFHTGRWGLSSLLEWLFLWLQKIGYAAWNFVPWALMGLKLFELAALPYFVIISVTIVYFWLLSHSISLQSEHQWHSIIKLPLVLFLPVVFFFFFKNDITLGQFLVSLYLFVLILYALNSLLLGLSNLFLKYFPIRLIPTESFGHNYTLYERRILMVPRMFSNPPKVWPYICLCLLYTATFFASLFARTILALLYSGRVADAWERARSHYGLANVLPEIIVQQTAASGTGSVSGGGSGGSGSGSGSGGVPATANAGPTVIHAREAPAFQRSVHNSSSNLAGLNTSLGSRRRLPPHLSGCTSPYTQPHSGWGYPDMSQMQPQQLADALSGISLPEEEDIAHQVPPPRAHPHQQQQQQQQPQQQQPQQQQRKPTVELVSFHG